MDLTNKRVLNLPLKKHWFEMIKSGEKKEEYREFTDFWKKRLVAKIDDEEEAIYFWNYDVLRFTLGYPKAEEKDKIMYFECDGITFGESEHTEWGGDPDYPTFIIKIGKRLE